MFNTNPLIRLVLGLALLGAATARAQHEPTDAPPETGHLELTFDERHPDSDIETLLARFRFRGNPNDAPDPRVHATEYNLEGQTFQAYIPDAYDGSEPFGLLVWVAADDRGEIPWPEVFDNRRLIVVSADGVGDRQNIWKRMGLQLDAVHNMTARYHIDPQRVYISGCSKGGRIASQLGLVFADVFDGAMPMDGCDWYQQIEVPGQDNVYYRSRFRRPAHRLLRIAKSQNRYVLMTGEHDENRGQTQAFFELGYERAGFEHVWYLEEEGVTHCRHSAAFVERGLALLDQPLEDGTIEPESEDNAEADDESGRDRPAREPRTPRVETAAQLLNLARNYLDAGLNERAKEKLETLLELYPESDEAPIAQELLNAL
ncbi:MAG: hypothetical protein AAGA29_07630 [Planctomycetota bacterium]